MSAQHLRVPLSSDLRPQFPLARGASDAGPFLGMDRYDASQKVEVEKVWFWGYMSCSHGPVSGWASRGMEGTVIDSCPLFGTCEERDES